MQRLAHIGKQVVVEMPDLKSPASKASFVGLIKNYDKQTDHYKVTYTRKIGVDGSLSKAFFGGSLQYLDMWPPDKKFKGGYFIKCEHMSFAYY